MKSKYWHIVLACQAGEVGVELLDKATIVLKETFVILGEAPSKPFATLAQTEVNCLTGYSWKFFTNSTAQGSTKTPHRPN